jgi:hypothetical protein
LKGWIDPNREYGSETTYPRWNKFLAITTRAIIDISILMALSDATKRGQRGDFGNEHREPAVLDQQQR